MNQLTLAQIEAAIDAICHANPRYQQLEQQLDTVLHEMERIRHDAAANVRVTNDNDTT